MEDNTIVKKAALVFVGGAFLLLIISWLYTSLIYGNINLSTDKPSDFVAISKIKNGVVDKNSTKQDTGKISLSVSPGEYELSAYNKGFSTTKKIKVKIGQSVNIKLSLASVGEADSVGGFDATGLYADQNTLSFIDDVKGYFYVINQTGEANILNISGELIIKKIRWVNSGLALAQSENGDIYLYSNGQLNKLSLPFKVNSTNIGSFDILPNNQMFFATKSGIYKGELGKEYKKIYSKSSANIALVASSKNIALANSGIFSEEEGETDRKPDAKLTILDSNGSEIRSEKKLVYQMAFTNNGNHLATRTENGVNIYDKPFKNSRLVPGANVGAMVWDNNDNLFYSFNNQIWRYDQKNQESKKITTIPGNNVYGLFFDISYSNLYSTGGNSSNTENYNIYRNSMIGKKPSSTTSVLNVFLPDSNFYCTTNYSNFVTPTIYVNSKTASYSELCMEEAKKNVEYYTSKSADFRYLSLPDKSIF